MTSIKYPKVRHRGVIFVQQSYRRLCKPVKALKAKKSKLPLRIVSLRHLNLETELSKL